MTYTMTQTEQLLGNLQLDESDWLDRFPCQVTVDEVCQGHIIKYKVMVNDVPVNVLYDTGMSMSCMAKWFFDTLPMKPKLISCNRYIAGMGGETLRPVSKYFFCLQIGWNIFWDRLVVIKNLRHKYILGQVLNRSYWSGTSYLTMGKHYITINGQVIAQSLLQAWDHLIIKTKSRITLPPVSVSIIEVKTPKLTNTSNLYKMNADIFQLPEGIILQDALCRVDHKTPQHPNVLVLNTNNVPCSIGKNMPIVSMHPAGKYEEVQEFRWSSLWYDTSKLLPQIAQNTSLQLAPDTKGLASSIPDADIPEEARTKFWE